MPRPEDYAAAERFAETGECVCGEHIDDHAEEVTGLSKSPVKCALTRSEVYLWNKVTAPPQAPPA